MDNSFIIKLFLNGKDVTEQYSVINAKIYRACNKIDKATISISAEIVRSTERQHAFLVHDSLPEDTDLSFDARNAVIVTADR